MHPVLPFLQVPVSPAPAASNNGVHTVGSDAAPAAKAQAQGQGKQAGGSRGGKFRADDPILLAAAWVSNAIDVMSNKKVK